MILKGEFLSVFPAAMEWLYSQIFQEIIGFLQENTFVVYQNSIQLC